MFFQAGLPEVPLDPVLALKETRAEHSAEVLQKARELFPDIALSDRTSLNRWLKKMDAETKSVFDRLMEEFDSESDKRFDMLMDYVSSHRNEIGR